MIRWILFAFALLGTGSSSAEEKYLSPLNLVANSEGKKLFVAESSADRVDEFDIACGRIVRTFALPGPPGGLALSGDGSELYVTIAVPNGQVCVVHLADGRISDRIPVGHTPAAVVVSPDGKMLHVCNRFSNTISFIDLSTKRVQANVPAIREPVAAAITPDGKFLYVASFLPAGRADGDYTAAAVSVIDTSARKSVTTIGLPNGSVALQAMCVSPDGRNVYVTHILARYQLPTTQLERGWMNTNAVSAIDAVSHRLINTVLLDDVDLGAANPWGIGCTDDGKYLCVAHAGTHELSVIDRTGLHERLARAAADEPVTEVSAPAENVRDDLAFLSGLRRRVKLDGRGPRGLAIVGSRVYATEYFSDSLAEVHIKPDTELSARSLPLGPAIPLSSVRRGAMLFHDATICFQQWQSCASCHPGDGRADGLNWDLLNDGIGNPKSTKSLVKTHETPPAMARGLREDARTAVRSGIRYILMAVRPETDALAIDAYLQSLEPVPSPHLIDGQLSDSARRGQTLFDEAGCGSCHPAPLYTDMNAYDVGTGQGIDEKMSFDTPTLIELWRTAPYLHDGRAERLVDVITECNLRGQHGRTADLTDQQRGDLIQFLLSQ